MNTNVIQTYGDNINESMKYVNNYKEKKKYKYKGVE